MEAWANFFVAEVGAAAALAGLLVVAMSINIEKIMKVATLPPRAAQTLVIIGATLVLASLGLFPGQGAPTFGWEATAIGVVVAFAGMVQTRAMFVRRESGDPMFWSVYPLVLTAMTALPPIIGGALLASGNPAGGYWIAVGVIVSFLTALQGGWVLLIEILR